MNTVKEHRHVHDAAATGEPYKDGVWHANDSYFMERPVNERSSEAVCGDLVPMTVTLCQDSEGGGGPVDRATGCNMHTHTL